MPAIRTTVAVLSCTALLGGLASPAFAQDTAGTYPSDTTNSSQTHKHKKGKKKRHGKLTDAQLTKVATTLGTTLEALKAAQAKVKSAVKATDERETRAQVDALLASELGVTVTELRAAFASVRPARGERRGHGERRGDGGHRGGDGGCKKPSGATDDAGGSHPTDEAGTYPTAA